MNFHSESLKAKKPAGLNTVATEFRNPNAFFQTFNHSKKYLFSSVLGETCTYLVDVTKLLHYWFEKQLVLW